MPGRILQDANVMEKGREKRVVFLVFQTKNMAGWKPLCSCSGSGLFLWERVGNLLAASVELKRELERQKLCRIFIQRTTFFLLFCVSEETVV